MKLKYILLLMLGVGVFYSCNLDRDPQGSVNDKSLDNAQGVDFLTTNAYATMVSRVDGYDPFQASPLNWVFGGLYGGDANKGSSMGDQSVLNEVELYKTLSTNDYLVQKWRWVYMGVRRSNLALQLIEKNKEILTDDFQKTRKGELKFLKTLCYYEGVKVFGAYIPWIDETNTENDPKIHNDIDIWENILNDIDEAISLLPDKQPEVGRVNIWAAKALKAKMLATKGELSKAKSILAEVLTSGKTSDGKAYGLEDKLHDNFNTFTENEKESVFGLQFSNAAENTGNAAFSLNYPHNTGPGGCCGFYQPSFELVNSFQVDANGLPYLDGEYRTKPSVTKPDPTGKELSINDNTIAVDPRLDYAVGRMGIPYKDWGLPAKDWVRDPVNGGLFMPKKHVFSKAEADAGFKAYYGGWAPGSCMNIQYMSFRELKLLYAECLADAGDLSGAMTQVNDIRTRAALPVNIITKADGTPAANYKIAVYPATHQAFSNKDVCVKAIRMERKLELAMEGDRWFDLVRWGGNYMSQELKKYIDYEKNHISKFSGAATLNPTRTMFPVPLSEIETMGNDPSGKPYLVQPEPWR